MKIDKAVQATASVEQQTEQTPIGTNRASTVIIVLIALCTCAFVFCFLVSVGVLHYINQLENLLPPYVPYGNQLTVLGLKVLHKLGLTTYSPIQLAGSNTVFTIITGIEFAIYALVAVLIRRQSSEQELRRSWLFIWLGVIVAGCILLITPALISRDLFVYAGYGRSLIAHHVNPYFVAPAKFPQDPITPLDDWKNATAAYGPLWLVVCSLVSIVGGSSPTRYILLFRFLAFAIHLINALLVMTILRTMRRSSRTVTIGTLLYAWNPLVILESSLSGHNDLFMITFMLLGILLCVRAEQGGFTRPIHYLLPGIAFTLATLVKFTALPLIILYLVLLARKTLYPIMGEANRAIRLQWKSAIIKVCYAGIAIGVVVLLFYGPFFIGHSVSDIVNSFSSPPSSSQAEHSMLSIIVEWGAMYGTPAQGSWSYALVQTLSNHRVWNDINIMVVLAGLIIGTIWLWRKPETRTLVFAAIVTLGGLLIVTTWFFPWYVTWLVGLAAVTMPTAQERVGRALFAFALTFSASARLLYLFLGNAPQPNWDATGYSAAVIPPLLVLLIVLLFNVKMPGQTKPLLKRISVREDTVLKT
ncbi:MAG TPA: hypothetical protein VKU38_17195 [Ktedonobacteraceae bacterium]|nr:hypothetical protein [Ktedonobacteraceae bacterium]